MLVCVPVWVRSDLSLFDAWCEHWCVPHDSSSKDAARPGWCVAADFFNDTSKWQGQGSAIAQLAWHLDEILNAMVSDQVAVTPETMRLAFSAWESARDYFMWLAWQKLSR